MPVTRTRHFDYTVTVDNSPIRLQLKRLSPTEYAEFISLFGAFAQHRGAPAKYTEALSEGETRQDGEAAAPVELTLDDVKAHTHYLKENAAWHHRVFAEYVSVVSGDLLEDGRPVTDGGAFYLLCRDQVSASDVITRIFIENSLSAEQKKRLRSRSGSATGSSAAPPPAPIGPTPATAAAPVAPGGSVDAAAATAPCSGPSSGMTARSSSESVPCAI
jgi:hypothetical protein